MLCVRDRTAAAELHGEQDAQRRVCLKDPGSSAEVWNRLFVWTDTQRKFGPESVKKVCFLLVPRRHLATDNLTRAENCGE